MLQLEQKLLHAFNDASLEFIINDEKIQNKNGDNICQLNSYYTIENYQPVLDVLKDLKARITDIENRVDDISTNRISIVLDNSLSNDRNKLYIELSEKNDEYYTIKIDHDYVTTVYKNKSFFWQSDYITTQEQITSTELSQYVEKMIDDIQTGNDIRTKQLTAFEKAGFQIHGSKNKLEIDKVHEVDLLPGEMDEGSNIDIALTEVADDYIPHIYELDGDRHALIDALSFPRDDISPSIWGTLFVPCDELEDHVYLFASDFKSFKTICNEFKTEKIKDYNVLSVDDFKGLELESNRTL